MFSSPVNDLVDIAVEGEMNSLDLVSEIGKYVDEGLITEEDAVEIYTIYLENHGEFLSVEDSVSKGGCAHFTNYYNVQHGCADPCSYAQFADVGFKCYPDNHRDFGIMLLGYQSVVTHRIDNYMDNYVDALCRDTMRDLAIAAMERIIDRTRVAFDVCLSEQPPDEDEIDDNH